MQFILSLGTMLLVAFLFTKIKRYIKNRVFNQLKKKYNGVTQLNINNRLSKQEIDILLSNPTTTKIQTENIMYPPIVGLNASIGKSYKKEKEPFSWEKFKKIFDLGNLVEWVKSFKEIGILDARKWVIIGIIVGGIYGYAYFQGRGDTPIQTNLAYEEEHKMVLNGTYIHKPKYSHDIYLKDTKTNKILKHMKAKDFPLLAKKLKPIGFILEPVGIVGIGSGTMSGSGMEFGAGVSWLKYWKWKIDSFLTNRGIYPLGTSYQVTDNTGIGLAIGKGYLGDNRIILYGRIRF